MPDRPAATGTVVPPPAADVSGRTILQVLPALGAQGGIERGTIEVADAIARAGARAVVASAGGVQVRSLERVGADHVTLPMDSKNPLRIARNVGRLARLIEREAVDLVHVRSRAPAWSTLSASRRTGVPVVTTFHGTYGHGSALKRAYNAVMTRGDRVIAISAFIAHHMESVYGVEPERVRIIHRGVDPIQFNPATVSGLRINSLARDWRLTDGLPVVLLPGRLTRWKGQVVFLEALARLGQRNLQAVLLGSAQGREAYRAELEDLVSHYGLGHVVRLVEHCDDMAAAYRVADVVVSASVDPEAFGRIAVEAQAMERLVIATDHGGARETVLPDATGWLVPPGDAPALTAALDRALKMPTAMRATMGNAARAHVLATFSKDRMCQETLAVYAELLGLRRTL